MRKFISGFTGVFAALAIFGASSVSAVVGDIVEGAGNAAETVLDGAENVIDDFTGGAGNKDNDGREVPYNQDGEVMGDENENEDENNDDTETETVTDEETETVTEEETETETETVTQEGTSNPTTGIEVATFGALALGSLAVAATSRKKR